MSEMSDLCYLRKPRTSNVFISGHQGNENHPEWRHSNSTQEHQWPQKLNAFGIKRVLSWSPPTFLKSYKPPKFSKAHFSTYGLQLCYCNGNCKSRWNNEIWYEMSFRVLFNHKYVILRTEDLEEHVIQNTVESCYLNYTSGRTAYL